jgi:hypothetical protein
MISKESGGGLNYLLAVLKHPSAAGLFWASRNAKGARSVGEAERASAGRREDPQSDTRDKKGPNGGFSARIPWCGCEASEPRRTISGTASIHT